MDLSTFVKVTHLPLETLIQRAYTLSDTYAPGVMHRREGELDFETIELLKNSRHVIGGMDVIHLNHVYGRIVGLMIVFHDGDVYIDEVWHGHSDEQMSGLIAPLLEETEE